MAEPLPFQTSTQRPRLKPLSSSTPNTGPSSLPRVKPLSSGGSNSGRSRLSIPNFSQDEPKPPKPRSLWEQINPISMAGQAVQGVAYLGKEVASIPINLARIPLDLSRAAGVPIPGESNMDWSGNAWQDVQAGYREYTPLLADIATGVRGTANITGIGSEKNIIGRYQQAVDEGNWVDTMLNDVGNAAIIAGGVGKALGSVASATAMPGQAGALARSAAATRAAAKAVSRTEGAMLGETRALSSAWRGGGKMLPPEIPYAKTIPSPVPGYGGTALRMVNDLPELKVTGVREVSGKGLAGYLERKALGDLTPSELAARGRTAPAQPRNLLPNRPERVVSGSQTAQRVADAGATARKFSLTAQYADPADALLGIYGRASKGVGKALAPKVVERAVARTVNDSEIIQKASSRLEQARNEAEIYSATRDASAKVEQAAIRFQYFVDANLQRLGMDQAARDVHGGIIADAADLTLNPVADAWRDLQSKPPAVREGILQQWNAMRPEYAQFTAERLDLYNAYRDGRLDPEVTKVLDEGLHRVRRAELQRRHTQQATGHLRQESLDVPTRISDGTPYDQLSKQELAAAFEMDDIDLPFMPSRVDPKILSLNEIVGKLETELHEASAHREKVGRVLDPNVAYRNALPAPGTDVPYSNTLEGRRSTIDAMQARIDELQDRADAAKAAAASDADIDAYVTMLNETIVQLQAEMAQIDSTTPTRQPVVVGGRSSILTQVEGIREAAAEIQTQAINDAEGTFAAQFGTVEARLERPGPTRTQATAMNADLVGDLVAEQAARNVEVDAKGNTRIEWYKKDSPVWKGRAKSREWYIKNGYVVPAIGENIPDAPSGWSTSTLGEQYRLGMGNSELTDMQAVEAYFDGIDRIILAREAKLADDALVEAVAQRLGTSDLEAIRQGLKSQRGYEQYIRSTAQADLADVTAALAELDDVSRQAVVDAIRADPSGMGMFLDDVIADVTGTQGNYGVNLDLLDPNMVATWIERQGQLSPAGKIEAKDSLIQALSNAFDELNALDGQKSGVDAEAVVQKSLAEIANLTNTMPDPVIGTLPDQATGQWDDGTFNQGVDSRQVAVKGGPGDRRNQPPRTLAENMIESEILAREEYRAADRDVWIAERRLEEAQRHVDDFRKEIDQSQQDMLYDNARGGVASMRSETTRVNQSGRALGGYELSDMGNGRLGGLVGQIAERLGLTSDVLVAVEADMETKFGDGYSRLVEKNRAEMLPDEFDAWVNDFTFDKFVDWAIRNDKDLNRAGRVNLAFNELALQADRITDPAKREIWDNARGELEQALVADDLHKYLTPFFEDNMMGGHAAYHALWSRIGELPPELRKHVSNDVEAGINTAFDKYRKRFNAELSATIDRNVSYIPARFRSLVQEARREVSGVLEMADKEWAKGTPEGRATALALEKVNRHAPTSFGMYAESGGAIPTHLIAGDGRRGATARPLVAKGAPSEVTVRRPMSDYGREQGMRTNTLRQYAGIEAREMTNIASEQGVLAMATDKTFSMAAAEVPGVIDGVKAWQDARGATTPMPFSEFQRILAEQGYAVVKGATPDSTPGWNGRMKKIEFNEAARADRFYPEGDPANMVVLTDPITGDPIMRDFDSIDEMHRLPNVRVVPTYIADVLNDVLNPTSSKWLLMYDQITQLWKTATLAWSVAWVTYNAIGNAMMASFSYGQSPATLVQNISKLRDELRAANEGAGFGSDKPWRTAMKNDTLSSIIPTRMAAHGPTWSERLSTQTLADADTRLGRTLDHVSQPDKGRLGRLTTFSYTLNEFTDNIFRTSVLMDDLNKRLIKEAPIPPELLNPNGTVRVDLTPAEQARLTDVTAATERALEASVRASLNTMGDFTRLNPVERKVVKRIFPFYPWMRHQTAMAFRMPMQNPLRWAWMQSLQDMLADDEDGDAMQELLSKFAITPFGPVGIAAANPFGQGITAFGSDSDGSSLFDPKSALAAVNPIAKFSLEMVTGIDLDQGAAVSRPSDQKTINNFGQQVGGSALSRIVSGDVLRGVGEVGYNALGLVSQTRGLRDLALGPQPRYDSGDAIPYADPRPGNRLLALPRAARVPFVPTNIDFQMEVAKERDRQAQRNARRYSLQQLARSGG